MPQPVRPPLGLPRGSVRALMTLLIVAVVIVELARGHAPTILWTESLMIALAHYFTSRRFITLPSATIQRLQEEGHLQKEPNPLYLPKHSIRAILILSFLGLAVWMYYQGGKFSSEALAVIGTVFAYGIGVMTKGVANWWSKKKDKPIPARWGDMKAMTALLSLAALAATTLFGDVEWLNLQERLDPERIKQLEKVAFAVVLFYFGSR